MAPGNECTHCPHSFLFVVVVSVKLCSVSTAGQPMWWHQSAYSPKGEEVTPEQNEVQLHSKRTKPTPSEVFIYWLLKSLS